MWSIFVCLGGDGGPEASTLCCLLSSTEVRTFDSRCFFGGIIGGGGEGGGEGKGRFGSRDGPWEEFGIFGGEGGGGGRSGDEGRLFSLPF